MIALACCIYVASNVHCAEATYIALASGILHVILEPMTSVCFTCNDTMPKVQMQLIGLDIKYDEENVVRYAVQHR